MIKLGNCRIGVSNNWRRMNGIPMMQTKRNPHERRDIPKKVRIHCHNLKKAGCDMEFIKSFLLSFDGYVLEKSQRRRKRRKYRND